MAPAKGRTLATTGKQAGASAGRLLTCGCTKLGDLGQECVRGEGNVAILVVPEFATRANVAR